MSQSQSTEASPPSHQVFSVHFTDVFLLKGWQINSTKDVAVVLLIVCFLAVIYEVIQCTLSLEEFSNAITSKNTSAALRSLAQRSVLHIARVVLGYILMLSVMTFNVWMLMTLVLAAGLGFLIAQPILNTLYSKSLRRRRGKLTANKATPPKPIDSDLCDAKLILLPSTNGRECEEETSLSDNVKSASFNKPLLEHVTNGHHRLGETVL
ncbi:probable low affinity copper uptake protein 2 isoform X1 [Biomphalaria glabrata]|uniref:Copper transport protein n=1 Tax=Biomphalaria glabrata TaxID=6526 RepID=A0A9U8E8V6_BIOGL|nr:probable low affinity copper uptake protein 2 isoform X1 [Biomphalaria glabrata]XP_013078310.2 probable low affinity copper uptake protein 2 isoform X1 [Biomphalaria glabrata]XP_013078311.2 probable low affinity copper uptake protein 2 isoform X1 [Biomphalaria glabrata]XP_013078312.2 probable low affinity copper uptake protein 2 isoform X1 [Biomphalaria glabrata]XP_013078313.2 probable low affinity copper uptake protein 2 isoform X1 [Biomphalaria glabrata]XP_055885793.1 probable low affinit